MAPDFNKQIMACISFQCMFENANTNINQYSRSQVLFQLAKQGAKFLPCQFVTDCDMVNNIFFYFKKIQTNILKIKPSKHKKHFKQAC